MRFAWTDGIWILLIANLLSLYLYLPAYLIAILAWWRRRKGLACLAGALAGWHFLAIAAPGVMPRHPPPAKGLAIDIASANLFFGAFWPEMIAAEIEQADPDIILLQEVSSKWTRVFEQRGWHDRYHYRMVRPRRDGFGNAIFSKLPLHGLAEYTLGEQTQSMARIQLEGREIILLTIHTLPPHYPSDFDVHKKALQELANWMRENRSASFIVAGDFNSTPYSRFSARVGSVADNAWDLAGEGFGHSFPNGVLPIPPLRIDHILLSKDLTASTIRLGHGIGSDHKPLFARIARRAATRD